MPFELAASSGFYGTPLTYCHRIPQADTYHRCSLSGIILRQAVIFSRGSIQPPFHAFKGSL